MSMPSPGSDASNRSNRSPSTLDNTGNNCAISVIRAVEKTSSFRNRPTHRLYPLLSKRILPPLSWSNHSMMTLHYLIHKRNKMTCWKGEVSLRRRAFYDDEFQNHHQRNRNPLLSLTPKHPSIAQYRGVVIVYTCAKERFIHCYNWYAPVCFAFPTSRSECLYRTEVVWVYVSKWSSCCSSSLPCTVCGHGMKTHSCRYH